MGLLLLASAGVLGKDTAAMMLRGDPKQLRPRTRCCSFLVRWVFVTKVSRSNFFEDLPTISPHSLYLILHFQRPAAVSLYEHLFNNDLA